MSWSAIFTVLFALIFVLGLMIALAALAKKFNLSNVIIKTVQRRQSVPERLSCRIGRAHMLSIVTLDGIRFAVLTGGGSEQFQVLPATPERSQS